MKPTQNKSVIILVAIIVALVIAGGVYAVLSQTSDDKDTATNTNTKTTDQTTTTAKPAITEKSNVDTDIAYMKSLYTDYLKTVKKEGFSEQATKSFSDNVSFKLESNGADPILCAQNVPTKVEFVDVSSTGMTVRAVYESGDNDIKIKYDLDTRKFTEIICLAPITE